MTIFNTLFGNLDTAQAFGTTIASYRNLLPLFSLRFHHAWPCLLLSYALVMNCIIKEKDRAGTRVGKAGDPVLVHS